MNPRAQDVARTAVCAFLLVFIATPSGPRWPDFLFAIALVVVAFRSLERLEQ
jgi:hypothetical protein